VLQLHTRLFITFAIIEVTEIEAFRFVWINVLKNKNNFLDFTYQAQNYVVRLNLFLGHDHILYMVLNLEKIILPLAL